MTGISPDGVARNRAFEGKRASRFAAAGTRGGGRPLDGRRRAISRLISLGDSGTGLNAFGEVAKRRRHSGRKTSKHKFFLFPPAIKQERAATPRDTPQRIIDTPFLWQAEAQRLTTLVGVRRNDRKTMEFRRSVPLNGNEGDSKEPQRHQRSHTVRLPPPGRRFRVWHRMSSKLCWP